MTTTIDRMPNIESIRRICVFCGSSKGARPEYLAAAQTLGRRLAEAGIELVYGGASTGLMGAIANSVLEAGGRVIGVIPDILICREVAHTSLTELKIVNSMHERKALMAQLSDAFIALPGGFGTMEELCEIVTWAMLGLHRKPIAVLNVADFYAPFLRWIADGVEEEFIRPQYARLILEANDPASLLEQLVASTPSVPPRWVDLLEKT